MKRLITFALVIVVVGAACGRKQVQLPQGKRITVVASAYPLFQTAYDVGYGRVNAVNLLPTTALNNDPLTPEQTESLLNADLAVILGGNTQPKVEAIAAQRTKPTVRILDNVSPIASSEGKSLDPRVWLDPTRMSGAVDAVAQALESSDGEGAVDFGKHAAALHKSLTGLDGLFEQGLKVCLKRTFVTDDPVFKYIANNYQLTQVGVSAGDLQPSVLGPAVKAADQKATTVFLTKLPSVDDARHLLDNYGLRAAVLNPLENQSRAEKKSGASYEVEMGLNLDALKAALGCTASAGGK